MSEENKNVILKFMVDSFRKIPNPYLNSPNPSERTPQMYVMICDVQDVPEAIPMDTNPRTQTLKTDVAKEVIRSFKDEPDNRNFYLLNRGLLLSAKSVSYNNETREVAVTFEDLAVHGDVDGGHTYEIIKKYRKSLNRGDQYIKIEVLTGVEEFFDSLAKARNYSVKVQDKSMDELSGKFDLIKEALKNESYFNDIAYVENEATKRIDITDIIAILNMFNIDKYPKGFETNFPVCSYSSKSSCLKSYREYFDSNKDTPKNNPYWKMQKIMPDIINLYDYLEKTIHKFYKGDATGIKQYGKITGVYLSKKDAKFRTRFSDEEIDYFSPNGFLYPIIGSFRALVVENNNGVYEWKKNPREVLDKIGNNLVQNTIQMSRDLGNNPNATGKKSSLWQTLYMTVQMTLIN